MPQPATTDSTQTMSLDPTSIDVNAIWEKIIGLSIEYAPKVVLAIIALFVGLRLIKWMVKMTQKGLEKRDTDKTLKTFLSDLIGWSLKVVLFVMVAQMFGFQTTSLIAIIGAAGLALGLALQGSLSNFAGGVLLLLFRPYKVNDVIDSHGYLGQVMDIQIFTTIMETFDGKTIIIPNGATMNGHIVNWTKKGVLRVEIIVGVSYDADIKKTKEILLDVIKKDERVLTEPTPPWVVLKELGDSALIFSVKGWVKPHQFFDVKVDYHENVKIALDKAGISIPYPQMDVHLDKLEPAKPAPVTAS